MRRSEGEDAIAKKDDMCGRHSLICESFETFNLATYFIGL